MKAETSSRLSFFLLPNGNSLAKRVNLGTFPLTKLVSGSGGNVTTKPFYCASRQDMAILAQCIGCDIQFGLEGMTTASKLTPLDCTMMTLNFWVASSRMSTNKTGFRITQYEGLECVDV